MTPEQIAKLPKWARDHIAGLERRLEMSEAANARFLGGIDASTAASRRARITSSRR